MSRARRTRTTERTWRLEDASGAVVNVTTLGEGMRVLIEIESAGMINGVLLDRSQALDLTAAIYRAARKAEKP